MPMLEWPEWRLVSVLCPWLRQLEALGALESSSERDKIQQWLAAKLAFESWVSLVVVAAAAVVVVVAAAVAVVAAVEVAVVAAVAALVEEPHLQIPSDNKRSVFRSHWRQSNNNLDRCNIDPFRKARIDYPFPSMAGFRKGIVDSTNSVSL